jgi:flotillin
MSYDNWNDNDGQPNPNDHIENMKKIGWGVLGVGVVGAGAFLATRYRIASPNEFIAKTGLGIRGISISKKTMQWPFQTAQIYNVNPFAHNFDLKCMSNEMIEMKLPIAFTMQPIIPDRDPELAVNYARRLLNIDEEDATNTISNVLEGTTRTLSGQLSIDELFHNREAFRDKIVTEIEQELGEIGLEVITANIKEMGDSDQNNLYFTYRKQRATESANHQARIDVAEAKKTGEIGVAAREGEIRIKTAAIERDATIAENERNQAIAKSNAELQVIEAEADRMSNQARVEAEIEVEKRRVIMERELEEKRSERELESERASKLAPTLVKKQQVETNAQADLYKYQREADAVAYQLEKKADADLYKANKEAEGIIAIGNAEAERIKARQNAHADGLRAIFGASGNDSVLTQFYVGLNDGLPQKQAEEAAKAVINMNPKMNIWTTTKGDGSSGESPISDAITNLARNLVPTMEAIDGKIKLPDYLPQLRTELPAKLNVPSTKAMEVTDVKDVKNVKSKKADSRF